MRAFTAFAAVLQTGGLTRAQPPVMEKAARTLQAASMGKIGGTLRTLGEYSRSTFVSQVVPHLPAFRPSLSSRCRPHTP